MSIIIFLIEKETFLRKYLILCKKHYVVISNSLDTGWRRIIYVTDTLLLHFHVLLASSNTHCENSSRRRYVRNYLYLSLEIFVITKFCFLIEAIFGLEINELNCCLMKASFY